MENLLKDSAYIADLAETIYWQLPDSKEETEICIDGLDIRINYDVDYTETIGGTHESGDCEYLCYKSYERADILSITDEWGNNYNEAIMPLQRALNRYLA